MIKLLQYIYGSVLVVLSEVCEYARARMSATELSLENYVSVENLLSDKRGKENSTFAPKEGNFIEYLNNDVLLGNIRPYLKKIWFADRRGGTNGDVLVVRVQKEYSNIVIPRYLYHCLASDKFFHYNNSSSKGAKMPRGDKVAIMNYEIALPSPEEQKRIANILDRFDLICNDLSDGIPAEIEARQKQYEYYRDKLLRFKKLS